MAPRPGLSLGNMTDEQRMKVHELLRASTSSQGYLKMTGAIRADQVLAEIENNSSMFGSALYYTTVFGNPEDANWAWMITGHHMSAMFTVAGDRTGFTPMFTGAQPLMIPSGVEAGWHVLPQDASRASELLATMTSAQQGIAILGTQAPGDVIAGTGRQASLSTFQGIPAAQLDAPQQRLLWLLVEELVGNADFDAADAQLALVQQTWADVRFAWQGPPPSSDAMYYFRVHGPRLLIEYDVQAPLNRNGGHIHAITRDPATTTARANVAGHFRFAGGRHGLARTPLSGGLVGERAGAAIAEAPILAARPVRRGVASAEPVEHRLLGSAIALVHFSMDIGAVGVHQPRVAVRRQLQFEHRAQRLARRGTLYRRDHLHAPLQVPLHAVGGANEILFVAAVAEVVDARVLQEPANDTHHAYRV